MLKTGYKAKAQAARHVEHTIGGFGFSLK